MVGRALTGSYPNPGLGPATAILNQSAQPQQGSLFLTGQLRTTGGLRLGSETGTAQAPLYPADSPGLVIRPINAAGGADGDVLARIGAAEVVRNGDDLINVKTVQPPVTYRCIHILESGAVQGRQGTRAAVNDYPVMDNTPSSSIILDAISVRCAVSAPGGHHGELVLSRASTSTTDWQGFVISTTNQ